MRYLILLLIPMAAYAYDDSAKDIAISSGLLIMSVAITTYRFRQYLRDRTMKDSIQTAIDLKPIAAAVGGGVLTFTATNIISLVGLCVGVCGAVIAYLQWRERKRANDLAEERLRWEQSKDKGEKVA